MEAKALLKKAFFTGVPKARPADPMWRSFFEFIYRAHQATGPDAAVLNIYSAEDKSGERERVYRQSFFPQKDYTAINFWRDGFIPDGQAQGSLHLPFPDARFDVVVTTKIVLEHVSDPFLVAREFSRVLKPGGTAFLAAPLIRRQHQKPYDYFRFTEFGLAQVLRQAGFRDITVSASNGAMTSLAAYAYFFQRQTPMPKPLAWLCDRIHYWVVEPVAWFLDRFDNGTGRDFSLYYFAEAKK